MNAYEFIVKMKDMASSTLQKVARSVGALDNRFQGVNTTSSIFSSGLMKLAGIVGGLILSFQIFNGVSSLFFKGVELEQTKTKFEVLLGSIEKGTAMLKDLNEYANFTPFSNGGIIQAAETMLGFGIAQEKIMSNMKMLGDVAMGNEQKLGSLSLVYSQVMATGRLMGQDLLQMINNGFNPLQIISENTGISMGVLKDKMEKGAISAAMVEEAFRLATSEGGRYYEMTDKMAKTAGGSWSTLMGTLSHTVAIVGEKFANWVSPLIDIGIVAANNILPFLSYLHSLYQVVTSNIPVLIGLGVIVAGVGTHFLLANASVIASSISLGVYNGIAWLAVTATGALEMATTALNFVMSMNPIAKVILIIGALISVIALLWNKFDWLRGGVLGIWEVVKGFGKAIKDYVINRFMELLSGITGIGKALVSFFKGNFTEAFEIGTKAVSDMVGVNSKKQFFKDGLDAVKSFQKGYNDGIKPIEKTIEQKTGMKSAPNIPGVIQPKSAIFDTLNKDATEIEKNRGKSNSQKSDSIVSGGSKLTNINITIEKLGTDTTINVDSAERGVNRLQELIQEALLRAVNSVNQMQTG